MTQHLPQTSPPRGVMQPHEDAMAAWARAPAPDRPALPMDDCLAALASHRDLVTDALTREIDFERRAQLIRVYDGIDAAHQVVHAIACS